MSDPIYAMSDEELLKADLSDYDEEVPPEEEEQQVEDQPEEAEEAYEDETDDESVTESEEQETDEEETLTTTDDSPEEEESNPEDNDQEDTPAKDEKDPSESDDGEKTNYEDFYKKVTSTFRAMGKEVQITDAEDILSLMQQGIGYSQKMAGLKPIITLGKTLEQHGLADPAKLSYMIDVFNKEPKALAKFIKESGVDLYEMDEEAGNDYVPENKVHEETKLQEVINELEGSPRFSGLLDTVAREWDMESKQFIVDNPGALRVLNEQVDSGLYDEINNRIQYGKMVGKYKDMSYLEIYTQIESEMNQAPPAKQEAPKVFKGTRPKPKSVKSNPKKLKATSPHGGNGHTTETFDPLRVSDEELIKYMDQQNKF